MALPPKPGEPDEKPKVGDYRRWSWRETAKFKVI